MKQTVFLLLILAVFLSACAAAPEPTDLPEPTKPSFPQGRFTGCIYYEGTLVKGFFNIYDENENFIKDVEGGAGDCTFTILTPGTYWVEASYWKGADCLEGCFTEEGYTLIEIQDGDNLEMDFEVKKSE